MTWEIRQGDALQRLREIPDESIHCCVTSPPYWGLRDYGTARWEGGDESCDHLAPMPGGTEQSGLGKYDNGLTAKATAAKVEQRRQQYAGICRKCGAQRVDGQLGLEPTPEEFVGAMVKVFAEVRRVLRPDGVCWLNIGDSYARSAGDRNGNFGRSAQGVGIPSHRDTRKTAPGLKPKDLAGIPWRLALALCEDGWYLRSDTVEEVELYCPCGCGHVMEERVWRHSPDREVIWSKPNPMPESVVDRPTRSHEYVFLLTKSQRYFYDAEAIREPDRGGDHRRNVLTKPERSGGVLPPHSGIRTSGGRNGGGRNKRSVWTIATRPFPEAHFATFPPDLVEPCILAGTPPKTCGECGAPWRRITEREFIPQADVAESTALQRDSAGLDESSGWGDTPRGTTVKQTLGWESTCDHADDCGHAVVLDPFAGAATTGLVATQRGRDFVGLELNPEYVQLGEDRIRRWEANPAGALSGPTAPVEGQIGMELA